MTYTTITKELNKLNAGDSIRTDIFGVRYYISKSNHEGGRFDVDTINAPIVFTCKNAKAVRAYIFGLNKRTYNKSDMLGK